MDQRFKFKSENYKKKLLEKDTGKNLHDLGCSNQGFLDMTWKQHEKI